MIRYPSDKHNAAVVDLTNANSDYKLEIGETGIITYSSATSVPLHVATVEGLYELDVVGEYSATSNGTYYTLSPNNTTPGGTSITGTRLINGAHSTTATDNFKPGAGVLMRLSAQISTTTKMKSLFSEGICIDTGNVQSFAMRVRWTDTTTAWTSLGTITLPFAQSGKIVIRRIA